MEIDINLKNSECTDLPLLLPLDVLQIDHSLQSPLYFEKTAEEKI